jgi:hypothetical protein
MEFNHEILEHIDKTTRKNASPDEVLLEDHAAVDDDEKDFDPNDTATRNFANDLTLKKIHQGFYFFDGNILK